VQEEKKKPPKFKILFTRDLMIFEPTNQAVDDKIKKERWQELKEPITSFTFYWYLNYISGGNNHYGPTGIKPIH